MASVLERADLFDITDQTGFNSAVWQTVVSDPVLNQLPHRLETNRHGQVIMSPPPAPEHGEKQFDIGKRLDQLMPRGHVIVECPVSTSEGVKLVDVAWISPTRRQAQRGAVLLTQAPEICVEVISPGNTLRELIETKRLYFAAGAEEVWFCSRDGRLEVYSQKNPETPSPSTLCPAFPTRLELSN